MSWTYNYLVAGGSDNDNNSRGNPADTVEDAAARPQARPQ